MIHIKFKFQNGISDVIRYKIQRMQSVRVCMADFITFYLLHNQVVDK